jgi:hypothetical protein
MCCVVAQETERIECSKERVWEDDSGLERLNPVLQRFSFSLAIGTEHLKRLAHHHRGGAVALLRVAP